jgi:hypothetical protein
MVMISVQSKHGNKGNFLLCIQVTDEVIMCYLARAHITVGSDRQIWSNGGMTISKGKPKKLEEKRVPVPLHPPQFSQSHRIEPGTLCITT